MIEDLDLDPLPDLPPELAELDAELRDIRIAERPSFGPELRAELERQWLEGVPLERARPAMRHLAAAAVAALFLVGLSVPPARASLAELSRQSLRFLGVLEEPTLEVAPAPALADAASEAPDPPFDVESPSMEPEPARVASVEEDEPRPAEVSRFTAPEVSLPQLANREADEQAARRYYPDRLQAAGIGGTVLMELWVDEDGSVTDPQIREGSGEIELDFAALRAALDLEFIPATRDGEPFATRVEFPMTFEPVPEERALPAVVPVDDPAFPEGISADLSAEWSPETVVPAPYYLDAQELLGVALGDDLTTESLGSLDNVLAGEPPAGISILRWRTDAADALQKAIARDSDNPAPYLALGRIRTKQGMRSEAKTLFERGLEKATRGSRSVSTSLRAELSYELGKVLETQWLPWKDLGSVPPDALDGVRCPWSGSGSPEDLIALNYLCSDELARVLGEAFEPSDEGDSRREEMLRAYRGAVEAVPGHVAANVELLLDLADDEQWFEMLNEARRFSWASRGHPYAFLLSGLALHRMGRSEEAADEFVSAFHGLSQDEAWAIESLAPLVGSEGARRYDDMDAEERAGAIQGFWRNLDPILITDVNEREVEHLARGTYAYLRFHGTDTDAGDVWVRYGRPNTIRTLGDGVGLRTEFWDYGLGPDITFHRSAASREVSLTTEAKTYVEELRQSFPHWYGTRSRSVFALPAQLGRFRGAGDRGPELEIHTEVPQILATGEADSLSLGLFLLGPGGSHLVEHRQSIRARTSTVRLPAVEAAGADVVVLEFYNPTTAQAAAVRSPVQRGAVPGEDARISDLLLVDPAAPSSREISRSDSWVVPRTSPDDASGDAVGLLFELYDLPESQDPYRMRVLLEPSGGGAARVLSYRPSGQMLFSDEWARMPLQGTRSIEYVTLDFTDVPAGDYVLRVHVDLPDGYDAIDVTREVERR